MTRRIALPLSLLLLGASDAALAGPLADCIASVEAAHPTATYEVLNNGSVYLSTSSLQPFLEAVEQWHDQPTFGLSGNAAGAAAIDDLLQCQVDNAAWTLSAAVLLRDVPNASVTGFTVGVAPEGEERFVGTNTTCDGRPALEYHWEGDVYMWPTEPAQGGAAIAVAVSVPATGLPEYHGCVTTECKSRKAEPGEPADEWGYFGGCLMECEPDGTSNCVCSDSVSTCVTL